MGRACSGWECSVAWQYGLLFYDKIHNMVESMVAPWGPHALGRGVLWYGTCIAYGRTLGLVSSWVGVLCGLAGLPLERMIEGLPGVGTSNRCLQVVAYRHMSWHHTIEGGHCTEQWERGKVREGGAGEKGETGKI